MDSKVKQKIPYVDVTFESCDSSFEALRSILEIVRPAWNPSKISSKILPNGMVNKNTVIFENSTQDETTAFVVKTQKEFYVGSIEETHKTCQFLYDQNLSCDMLAFFNNGICMEFVRGKALNWNSQELQKDENWKIVAEKLAKWHSKDILQKAKKAEIRSMNITLGNVDRYWDSIMSRDPMKKQKERFPSKEEILFEEKSLREDMLGHAELHEVLCHMDMHTGNFILQGQGRGQGRDQGHISNGEINDEGNPPSCPDNIKFIDYDFTGLSFAQYELVAFFYSFIDPSNPNFSTIPDHDYQRKFLEHYLRHRNYLNGEDFDADEVERLFNQVQIASLFVYLRFIVGTAFVCDLTGLDTFIPFVERLWREFHETKENLLRKYRYSEEY